MYSFLHTGMYNELSSHIVAILIPTFVNSTIFFSIMFLVIAQLTTVSASSRHRMWFFVLCGIFVLASFSRFFPHFDFCALEVPVHKEVPFIAYDSRLLSAPGATHPVILSPEYTGSYSMSSSAISLQWSSLGVLVWISGMGIVLLRIVVGKIGLFFIFKNSHPTDNTRSAQVLGQASACLHLNKKIALRISRRCMVPFTFSILRPIILLPQNVDTWPDERLYIVLLHELAHIKRRDHITRGVARLACVLFWFIPAIWILYRILQREEENSCDAIVVNSNVKPATYAGHLMDIIRLSGGKVFLSGLDHALARKGMLEKRITGILSLKKKFPASTHIFVTRFLSVFLSCLFILLAARPFSADDYPGIIQHEAPLAPLYGRWLNPDYDASWKNGADCINKYAKLVIDRSGNYHSFQNTFTYEYSYIGKTGTWAVENSWIDRTGDCWYEVICYYPFGYATMYHLWKIDKSGSVLEIMYHFADYPPALDREEMEYRIYYRH